MFVNRIRKFDSAVARPSGQASGVPNGFVLAALPAAASLSAWQVEIYRSAFEKARAAAASLRLHRRFFSNWN